MHTIHPAIHPACARTPNAPRRAVVAALFGCLLCVPALAQQTIHHPEDGFPTIQDAVEAAGCGGTVLLAAGTYNERVWASCSVRLIGAGVGQTVIDASGLYDPTGAPAVIFGGHPFAEFDFTGPYELAQLTVRGGPDAAVRGVGMAWTYGVRLHDLRVEGIEIGINALLTTDLVVEDVSVSCEDAPGFRVGISTGELDNFRDHLPDGHMTGIVVRDCTVEDAEFGIHLVNVAGASITGCVTHDTTILGMQLLGATGCQAYGNVIEESGYFAGFNLQNCHDANIHHNLFLHNDIALHYEESYLPDAWGFGPSSGNRVHHNIFQGNTVNILEEDPYATDNRAFKNLFLGG